uniref:Repat3 n=1 Tax=Spodoptera exigua TaxID=7107 RepID=A8QVZ4_SPOEX|nr:Repat3 [Spodoptera exigua]
MKSFIIIVVLSALAACYDAAVLPSEEEMSQDFTIVFDDKSPNGMVLSRADFNARYEHFVLLSESKDFVPAIKGQEQSVTMLYRAQRDVKIGMIAITSHFIHLPEIVRSPLGKNYIEVTLKSRVGQGLNTTIQTYRWKCCQN